MPSEKIPVRVLSCGSVDDGKSTLIGRILHDCGILFEDQLKLLEKERTAEGLPDFSCLLDGLLAEREQAITIDVAYRSFTTDRRRYLVADAPGHEQYTRNMVTGASRADVALLLVDAVRACDGLLPQTVRHAVISSLMGIPDVIVAVNKMDCVGYSQAVFADIERQYREVAGKLRFRSVLCVPVSALRGDNVCAVSEKMSSWYPGPSVMELLESLKPRETADGPLRMAVQWVARAPGVRGLSGTLASGKLRPGQQVKLQPSGTSGSVKRSMTLGGDLESAVSGQAVSVQLAEDLDVGRGEVMVDPDHNLEEASELSARVVWLNEPPLVSGRSYIFRLGTSEARATVTEVSGRLDLNALAEKPAHELHANDIGRVKISLDRKIPVAHYSTLPEFGSFLLIDPLGSNTLGAGMIEFALRRGQNVQWQKFELDKAAYAKQKAQKPFVLWFTGLSASGKSTLADLTAKTLYARGRHVFCLDGDNLRHGLNRDLGFSESDRAENIRRAAETSKLLVNAGLIVLASFISPYRMDRAAARELFDNGEFFELFVDTPVEVCARRDPKGLYAKAYAGQIPNFTGVTAPFEAPESPDIRLCGEKPPEKLVEKIVAFLDDRAL